MKIHLGMAGVLLAATAPCSAQGPTRAPLGPLAVTRLILLTPIVMTPARVAKSAATELERIR